MSVRLPSAAGYSGQVLTEHRWLPRLAPLLPPHIPVPLAIGEPAFGYPWKWSVYRWLSGVTADSTRINNASEFASTLARFLIALQRADPLDGPRPGPHNFYRGGSLSTYSTQTREAIFRLHGKIDTATATALWDAALDSYWEKPAVWIHDDVNAGNLLVDHGRLNAVIDFGQRAVGDPACDLAISWTFFAGKSRRMFRTALALDKGTWARARAWALWKTAIIASGMTANNAVTSHHAFRVIANVLAEHRLEATTT